MSDIKDTFSAWALVELFGHQRIVGRVSEQQIGASILIRVDVPDAAGQTKFTRFYGVGAIYSISPIDEAVALRLAQVTGGEPVRPYELPQIAAGEKMEEEGA